MATHGISCAETQSDLLRWLSERQRRLQQRDSWLLLLPWTNCQRRTSRRLQKIRRNIFTFENECNNYLHRFRKMNDFTVSWDVINNGSNHFGKERSMWENAPAALRRVECSSKRFKPAGIRKDLLVWFSSMKNFVRSPIRRSPFPQCTTCRNAYALSWQFEKVQESIWRTADENRCPDTADRSSFVGMIGLLDVLPLWYIGLCRIAYSPLKTNKHQTVSHAYKKKKTNKREWIRNVRPRVVNKNASKTCTE